MIQPLALPSIGGDSENSAAAAAEGGERGRVRGLQSLQFLPIDRTDTARGAQSSFR